MSRCVVKRGLEQKSKTSGKNVKKIIETQREVDVACEGYGRVDRQRERLLYASKQASKHACMHACMYSIHIYPHKYIYHHLSTYLHTGVYVFLFV